MERPEILQPFADALCCSDVWPSCLMEQTYDQVKICSTSFSLAGSEKKISFLGCMDTSFFVVYPLRLAVTRPVERTVRI